MLLSSAKFELSSAGPEPVEIDVTKRVGVDLILPVASLLPLERRVQWEEKMEIPRQVLDTLADSADTLAAVLIGGKRSAWTSSWPSSQGRPPREQGRDPRSDRGRQDGRVADSGRSTSRPARTTTT